MAKSRWCLLLGGLLIAGMQLVGVGQPALQPAGQDNLELQYAQARLALAEANLKKMESINAKVRGAVAGTVVDDYRDDITVANKGLEEVPRGGPDSFAVWLSAAEAKWRSAVVMWRTAAAANDRQPNTVDALNIERMRLRAEVYRLDLERGRAAASRSHEDQLQWRVSVLSDEIERLNERVFRPQNRAYPYWFD
jgi:hypothetical protein